MPKRKTTSEFIQQAIAVHGNKYGYSDCEYVNTKTKVKIICPEHGVFEQTPNNHLSGQNCPTCGLLETGRKNRSSTREFVGKASQVHGNKYDYSLVEYVKSSARVKIICPEHGIFEQLAYQHIQGHGCPDCGVLERNRKKRSSTREFVEKAIAVHGDKYDYSLVEYVGSRKRVKVTCFEHGAFWAVPSDHLCGCGCPTCGLLEAGRKNRSSTREFVEKAIAVHGNKYDYSLSEYLKKGIKVKIICSEHGLFKQEPVNHVKGQGCPRCARTGFDSSKPGLIYFLKFEKPFASFWKVGITNRTLEERFRGDFSFITSQHTWELEIGFDAYQVEQLVLKEFKKYRFDDGFLFSLLQVGGDTECFVPTMPHQKVIDFIEARVKSVQSAIAA